MGSYKVIWRQQDGEDHDREVEAHSMAEASWKVARDTFDCVSPGDWLLLDVVRLS